MLFKPAFPQSSTHGFVTRNHQMVKMSSAFSMSASFFNPVGIHSTDFFFPEVFYCFSTFHQAWVAMAIKQAILLDFTFAVLLHTVLSPQSKHGGCYTHTDVGFCISFLSVLGSYSPETAEAALCKLASIFLSNGHHRMSHLLCDLSFKKDTAPFERCLSPIENIGLSAFQLTWLSDQL